jgi:molybdate transport system permease protein
MDMDAFMELISNLDWTPLLISLKTGVVATVISFFLGIFAARKVVRAGDRIKAIADGFLTLPMVLPPTVAGFFLLLLFSKRRPIGMFLFNQFGIKVVQTWLGCIIAATVIAFPLMYRNARAAFEQLDANLIYAGRTLGMSESAIFWKVVVPNAGPGIISGTILTFARALGEYGATSMLAGNIPGKTSTISQKIAMVIQDGDYMTAGVWVVIILMIAFGVIVAMNLVAGKNMKNIQRW